MKRLKAWLEEHRITIVYPGIASKGLVTLLLRPPFGNDLEVAFYPDDLENDPEDAIAFIESLLANRRITI
jgi:hypothetical protein